MRHELNDMSGASSSRCSPTSCAACRGWMTSAFSMASFGSCDQCAVARSAEELRTAYMRSSSGSCIASCIAEIRLWKRAFQSTP
jgi:hypothetical protein